MAFFKFRQNGENPTPSTRPAESVEVMRQRAKHRLIGAAVLVLIGVLGFPMLFDTQPRPIPVDVQIEIPDRNKVAPLTIPATPDTSASPVAAPEKASAAPAPMPAPTVTRLAKPEPASPAAAVTRVQPLKPAAPDDTRVTARASLDDSEQLITPDAIKNTPKAPVLKANPAIVTEAKPASKPESKPEPKPVAKPEVKLEAKADSKPEPKAEPKVEHKAEVKAEPKPEHKPEPKPEAKASPKQDDGARAKSLLEGKEPAKESAKEADKGQHADDSRFIIQVGAYADPVKAREARAKLEKAGLKTYTHVAETKDGQRIRVRLGPFANKAEAEKAAGKVKHLALPAAILTL